MHPVTRRSALAYLGAGASALTGCAIVNPASAPFKGDSAQLAALDASAAARHIAQGDFTCERYAAALLAQCALRKDLNALTWIDEAKVLESARAVDRRRAQGAALGPLGGLPFLAKDNIDTVGFPTTAGTPGLRGNLPSQDAEVVARLKDSGALLLAKTNMHELAAGATSSNASFGPVRNPYGVDRIPGGSSGGTAAALAARMAPIGFGTDTSGSVLIPAALCGIVAMRPTSTRPKPYADTGVVPLCVELDTIGPIARCVEDLALLHNAVTRGATPISRVALQGKRFGIPRQGFWEDLPPEVASASENALAKLRDAGATLVDVDFTAIAAAAGRLQRTVVFAILVPDLRQYLLGRAHAISYDDVVAKIASPDVKAVYRMAAAAAPMPADAMRKMLSVERDQLRADFESLLRSHSLEGLLLPTVPVMAFPIEAAGDKLEDEIALNGKKVNKGATITRNTRIPAALGVPALTVPCGLANNGLPVGLQLVGAAGADAQLLGLAMSFEATFGRLPPPSRTPRSA